MNECMAMSKAKGSPREGGEGRLKQPAFRERSGKINVQGWRGSVGPPVEDTAGVRLCAAQERTCPPESAGQSCQAWGDRTDEEGVFKRLQV